MMVFTWKQRLARLILDLVAALVIGGLFVGLFVAENRGYVVKRGFFCNDPSVRFPYRNGTVPTWALVIASLGIPLIVMFAGAVFEGYIYKQGRKNPGLKMCANKIVIPPWLLRLGYHARWFIIGLGVNLVITDVGKLVVGRLRPHFIDVCDPDFSEFNCTDPWGNPLYVTNYTCRGDIDMVNAARVSWPSGHSSISAYAFVFTAFYVSTVRMFYRRNALKLLLMLISVLLALITGLSRISDYKHHPTDVLSGMIIGAGVAISVVYYNLYYFGENKVHHQTDSEQQAPLNADIHYTTNKDEVSETS